MALRNIIAIAGGVLGFLVAGPAGFSIGMAIGSIIGAIVDPQVVKGPRLKDLDVQISSYGDAISRCWGWVRLSGNVIWATDLVEKKDVDKGLLSETVEFKYYGNWSTAFCEGPVGEFRRVWADSKLIYGYDEEKHEFVSKYSDRMSFHYGTETEMPSSLMESIEGDGNVPPYRGIVRIDFHRFKLKNFGNRIPSISAELYVPPSSGPRYATIEFNWGPANGRDLDTMTKFLEPFTSGYIGWAAHTDGKITVGDDIVASWYTGDNTSDTGPEVVTIDMEAYRRHYGQTEMELQLRANWFGERLDGDMTVTVKVFSGGVIEDVTLLPLTEGNVIEEKTYSFNVDSNYASAVDGEVLRTVKINPSHGGVEDTTDPAKTDGVPLGSIVRDICIRAGLEEGLHFDVSQLHGRVMGYFVNQEATGRQLIEPLAQAYLFDGVEIDGVLVFRHRNRLPTLLIPEHHLGAQGEGETPGPLVKETRTQELELPSEVSIKYVDRKMNYNQNAAKARRAFETQKSESKATLDLPITLSPGIAKAAAEVILQAAWVGRTKYEFSVPRAYIQVDASDIVQLTFGGQTVQVYVETVDFGADASLKITGYRHELESYTALGLPAPDVSVHDPELEQPSPMVPYFIDGPLLDESDETVAGVYVVAEGEDQTVRWPGGAMLDSYDDTNFTQRAVVWSESVIGKALNALPDHSHAYLDRTNYLDVQIDRGTLVGVGVMTMLNGENFAMLGDELIQFANAVVVNPNPLTYRLTTLVRGAKGTDWATAGHAINDRFLFLDNAFVTGVPILNADLGVSKKWRAVTDGLALEDTASFNFTAHSNKWKPLSPVNLRAVRTGTDIGLSWSRRARVDVEWRDIETLLDEPTEKYEIDVMSGTTVKRTITVTGTSVATYTTAQQVTDFGSAQPSVTFRVYQISSRVGRGYPCERTI